MSPLTVNFGSPEPAADFPQLVEQLSSRPSPAVVHYDSASGDRVELSGRVLSNWAVKLTGLLREEYELDGETVVVDVPVHWKAAAIALASAALGAEVVLHREVGGSSAADPAVVFTDRPQEWIVEDAHGAAELAAVSLGLLDTGFTNDDDAPLPAWVLDVSAEVRQHPDQLMVPLDPVALPVPEAGVDSPLVLSGWSAEALASMVEVWARAGVVVLFQGAPEGETWQAMLRNEGLA